MRRYTAGRSAARSRVRTHSESRPFVRRSAPESLTRAAARQRASQLMAPGPALTLPRLAGAALEPFQPRTAYSGAFGLARNLLLAEVGRPEDWEQSKGDPVAFMLRTVERAAAGFNRKAIDGVAHTDILFGTSPYISSWHERECETPDRVFLAVEATHISIVYLRPTLELLAKAHPRLPATFYRMLLESVCSWILCYDESACEAFYEWRMEAYEEAQQSGEEGLEKPQSIATAKGPWLAKRFQPLPPAKIDAAHRVVEILALRCVAFLTPLAGSTLFRKPANVRAHIATCGTSTIPTAVSRFRLRFWRFMSRIWCARPFRATKRTG